MTKIRTRFAIGSLLKVAGLVLFAIWVASSNTFVRPNIEALPRILTTLPVDGDANLAKSTAAVEAEAHLLKFSAAQEASLVALRGYLLTGSQGFKSEWAQALATVDAMELAITQDSRSWTDGQKLMELADVRKTTLALREEEKMLISIIATPNQYPGFRLYREDVDPALMQIARLLDEALQSELADGRQPSAGANSSVDLLAQLRGKVRDLRQQLLVYLPSGDMTPPAALRDAMADYEVAPAALAPLRMNGAAQNRERLAKVVAMIQTSDAQLRRIFALKKSPQWDYADYAFKQRVLPLTEKILKIVGGWRASS